MRTCFGVLVVVAVVAGPGAWAQPLEFEATDPPSQKKRSPAPKQRDPQARGDAGQSGQGRVYTYADGDRTVRVRLQSDLEVSGDGSVARSSGEHIVTKDSARRSTGQPVFRSESSGSLMTLPGGVLLVLDAEWSKAETNAFFARNRIKLNRVSALDIAANSFFVETEPGFPSLNLANALAAQEGVRISSPNWWREHTAK
ncbi:MAG: hypothetical protein J4F42_13115 [Desulfurellaceae bacterium]|nr:hypothetical protein [Desulfurellaceae bacterium]